MWNRENARLIVGLALVVIGCLLGAILLVDGIHRASGGPTGEEERADSAWPAWAHPRNGRPY